MVLPASAVLIAAHLLLPRCSLAASLYGERDSVLRKEQREQPQKMIQMSTKGELIRTAKAALSNTSGKPREMVQQKHKTHPWVTLNVHTKLNLTQEMLEDLSRWDWPPGQEGTNLCSNPSNEVLMQSVSECMFAGEQSGATVLETARFEIGNDGGFQDIHPKACFKTNCSESSAGCYYYNLKAGGMPSGTIEGTPICRRPRFLKAAAGTNDKCGEVAEPSGGYQVLEDEFLCSVAGTLFGEPEAPQDRVGILNASQKLEHPVGCFIDPRDNRTYYNARTSLHTSSSTYSARTDLVGIQICNVSSVTKWT